MCASECLSSRLCANPRAPALTPSRLIEPSLTPTPLSLVVLPSVPIDKRGLTGVLTRSDEAFGWSKRPLKSTYVGFAQTSPVFCKKDANVSRRASSPSHRPCREVSRDVWVCVCRTFRCCTVTVTAGQLGVGGEHATRTGLRERPQISTSGLF